MVSFQREALELELWAYGEDELSAAVPSLSPTDLGRIGERAGDLLLFGPGGAHGSSMMIPQAICLAAVEVMTGEARPLRRSRRRSRKDYPGRAAE